MHKLSVGAIFNNEAPYLKEWLEHYLDRGVEHFYLINDYSEDNYQEILKPYFKYITLFDTPKDFPYIDGRQEMLYNYFFLPIKEETKWFLICDIDEYVWCSKYLNIKEALDLLESNNIYYYEIPMVLFGSNNHIVQPESIVKSFTKRQELNEKYFKFLKKHLQVKPIFKSDQIKKFIIHWHFSICEKNRPFFKNPNDCLFRLNHYRLQSEEKWIKNLKKNDVNGYTPKIPSNFSPNTNFRTKPISEKNYRNMEIFYQANKEQNIIEDFDLVNQNKEYNL